MEWHIDTNGALYPFLLLLAAHIGLVHGVDVGAYILEASVTEITDFVLITPVLYTIW